MSIAKLKIIDEVNCKFEGVDVSTRRKLVDALKYYLPYARHLPAVKLGRWDGSMSFCDIGGRTYINLLDKLLPILQAAGYEIEIEDNRIQQPVFEFDEVEEDSYSHIKWPKGHQRAGEPISIKPHQVDVINSYLNNIQSISIIPTGGGKTLITGVLSHKVEKYGKSVIIVPSKDLVTQTEEDYKNMGLDVGVLFGDRKEYNKTHTICTWQTLESLYKNNKELLYTLVDGVACVIADECFHADSRVLTRRGYIKISEINIGDIIINYSEIDNIFKEDIVKNIYKNLTKSSNEKMYELEFDNGNKIKVTGNHKFLTQRGWVRADQLLSEDDIKNINT